ncbi:MAG: transporter substrate-binding domain-containing protein [Gammaproteobacteria bacterium]|nr:MAG: transporter substrate-binding domain-containing protein [Gammaproteobacteria bacterium]
MYVPNKYIENKKEHVITWSRRENYYEMKGIHGCQWLALICLASWLAVPGPLLAKEILVLNTAFTFPLSTDEQTGFVDVVVKEALGRTGFGLESVRLPAERALINANAGIDDGDLLRIAGLQKTYPNLIQVPEKIIDLEFVVFTKHAEFPITGWRSLEPYSVAIVTGWKILERNINETVELTKVKNVDQLFTMLLKDRVDTLVYSRWDGLGFIKQRHIRGVRILEPPLVRRGMYVYLHKKHQHLVPKLAAALRAMKADGSYRRTFQQILAPVAGE